MCQEFKEAAVDSWLKINMSKTETMISITVKLIQITV